MRRAPLYLGIILSLLVKQLTAQQDQLMASISVQLEQLVDVYVKESFLKHRFAQDVNDLRLLFGPKAVDSLQLQNELAEKLAEMNVIHRDKGLNFQSTYANNFAGSFLEDDGTFYQWRATTGLNWDLFKGGLIAQKQKLEQKRLEYEATLAEQGDKLGDLSYRKSFDYIIYTFNKEKIKVIQNRLNILSNLLEVVEKMYYLRFSHWEDVLDVMSKKAETELFLNNYLVYIESIQIDSSLKDQAINNLPVFDLLFEKIEKLGIDTLTQSLILEKNLKALDHQFHWSNNLNFNAQLKYNYYDGGINSTYVARDFLAGGLSVSIPLPFNQEARKSWKEAKQQKYKSDYESYQKGLNNELLTHYYEYEYAHKQYVEFFYRKEQLAVNINRSIRKRLFADPDYSPMAIVDKLDELFSVDLELIDIQQKMYLKALKLFSLINAPDILPFIEVKDYNLFVRQYDSDRVLFCTSDDVLQYETNFLVEFFRENGVKQVCVEAAASAESYLKYAALLDAAVGTDLVIYFSIDPLQGKSSIAPDLQALTQLSLTPKLHFDLRSSLAGEPSDYDEIIETLRNQSQSFDISVSIPISIDHSLIQTLLPFVSKIYVVPESSYQLEKLYGELINGLGQNAVNKVCPVVIPQDFTTKLELNNFIDQLVEHLQIEMTAISEMTDLIDLDKKMVGWHEEYRF